MALQADDLSALIIAAERSKKRRKVYDLMSDIQQCVAVQQLMKRKPMQTTGTGREWHLLGEQNDAETTGLYHVDNVTKKQGLKRPYAPWRRWRAHGSWDLEEVMMDAGEDAVLDWILLEDAKMMQGFLEKMERMFWVLPDASDTTSMWGVGNYIVYVDGATGSFASTLPNGYSDKQGLAVTDLNGRYGNWSDTYVNISEEDLIDKMQSGMFHTKFVPPMQNPILHSGVDRAFYCEHSTVRAFGRKLKGQNDNLGPDVAWGEGKAVINGAPLVPVPALEQGTVAANLVDSAGTALSGPIWQIDWAQFKVCALRGNWMRKTPPRESPTQSTVVVRHVYATANITDVNPRALAVYAK